MHTTMTFANNDTTINPSTSSFIVVDEDANFIRIGEASQHEKWEWVTCKPTLYLASEGSEKVSCEDLKEGVYQVFCGDQWAFVTVKKGVLGRATMYNFDLLGGKAVADRQWAGWSSDIAQDESLEAYEKCELLHWILVRLDGESPCIKDYVYAQYEAEKEAFEAA